MDSAAQGAGAPQPGADTQSDFQPQKRDTLACEVTASTNTTLGTTMGNLGMTETRFPKPVFHGDTLRAQSKVVAVRASKSRPNAGIVEFEHRGFNQRGEEVAYCRRQAMMLRRPA